MSTSIHLVEQLKGIKYSYTSLDNGPDGILSVAKNPSTPTSFPQAEVRSERGRSNLYIVSPFAQFYL